jgi:hypothetical protein
MNKFTTTLCIVGTAMALSACGTSYDSGANYATQRTAGNVDKVVVTQPAPVKAERVFREVQSK